ncbi:VOC family protein [Lentzea aerocolonigenes]|uniref:VOC family protein n=1 Tax=Lentzea aerocolonigenes TaxID=68170 RepID=UPI0004C332A0|nr:VOC family protein [Lentzea aerocolonigenes]MCP2246424.1 Glyoxalase-like domain-containing protein [Lentzea aerocolonigenes]
MPALAQLTTIVLDCADPGPLAEFYRAVTGWEVTSSGEEYAYLGSDGVQLALVRVPDYRPPSWPGPDKQAHLDFQVADIDLAVKQLLELGATKPDFQPGGDEWTVLADPQGHLLCLAA